MNARHLLSSLLCAVCLVGLIGCGSAPRQATDALGQTGWQFEMDRRAILGMAGTFKVSFQFNELSSPREGYELGKPYSVSAEEMVVVAEDRGDTIVLQHLLVVRHGGQAHIIHHWRQDWSSLGGAGYEYNGGGAWQPRPADEAYAPSGGGWLQSVYNVDDSPRYSSRGNWVHEDGASRWTGSSTKRPLPLREKHLSDQYDYLDAINTHVVSDAGWVHRQMNRKIDPDHPTQPVLSIEHGLNTYTRVVGEGFGDARDYWQNTEPFWKEVRGVWADVLAKREPITLRSKWKGDTMYTHLSGLADEYWGEADASAARVKIQEVIDAFTAPEPAGSP